MHENELRVAVAAVRKACDLCRSVRAAPVTGETITKKDKSPVTIADLGAQAVMSSALTDEFDGDPIVAEEDTELLRQPENAELKDKVLRHVSCAMPGLTETDILTAIDRGGYKGGHRGRFWTMDPIDGTKGFIRGDQYAVALALIEDGEVVLGVLGCPNLPVEGVHDSNRKGVVFAARRGAGAEFSLLDEDGTGRLSVAEITDPAEAVFCESVESAHTAHGAAAEIVKELGGRVPPVRIDSQCKYGVVARGDASVYLRLPTRADYEEKIWDHAAGWIVVEEAGGKVTDIHDSPLDFSMGRTLKNNKGVVATNGRLHGEILAAIKRAGQ